MEKQSCEDGAYCEDGIRCEDGAYCEGRTGSEDGIRCENHTCNHRICDCHTWGIRKGHTAEVVETIKSYLRSHPADYCDQMGTLLELIYQSYTEFDSVETPEFKAIIDPLDEQLRSLVETDEEADEYMNVVFELCAAYEKQSYIEGMKVGARLMMELAEG